MAQTTADTPPSDLISPPEKPRPKRFIKNQIPDSILNDAALNAAISLLPSNYTFEIHKIIWRVRSTNATRVALQFPEGLLMYSLVISDILTAFAGVTHCFILGDVTYGACCIDDLAARALDAQILVHFGHSCLVPIDSTTIPVLYIFVEIAINTRKLVHELNHNFNRTVDSMSDRVQQDRYNIHQGQDSENDSKQLMKLNENFRRTGNSMPDRVQRDRYTVHQGQDSENDSKQLHPMVLNRPALLSNFIMAGTIQFSNAIRVVKPELEKLGFTVMIPQSKPLSAGEVLGCTAPSVKLQKCPGREDVIIFVADGRFHLEAFMIANPGIRTFRYDPYLGKLFLEEYDHVGMKADRRRAIERARGAKSWGIVLGTLGRQGNPRVMERLEGKMRDKGFDYMVVLISELSPKKIELFGNAVDAWVQIACPRLSIDWGDAFKKPLLTTFEAEIALGDLPGWWERKLRCKDSLEGSRNESCCENENVVEDGGVYPMDYYAQDGGDWNSCYSKKPARARAKNEKCCNDSCGK